MEISEIFALIRQCLPPFHKWTSFESQNWLSLFLPSASSSLMTWKEIPYAALRSLWHTTSPLLPAAQNTVADKPARAKPAAQWNAMQTQRLSHMTTNDLQSVLRLVEYLENNALQSKRTQLKRRTDTPILRPPKAGQLPKATPESKATVVSSPLQAKSLVAHATVATETKKTFLLSVLV